MKHDLQQIILVLKELKVETPLPSSFASWAKSALSQCDNWVIHIGSMSSSNSSRRRRRLAQAESWPEEPSLRISCTSVSQ